MKADPIRIKQYLAEIRRNSIELNQLIDDIGLAPDSIPLKAAKYILIELAEAMSNTIQHILAKDKGIAVSGYMIHRYWAVDDIRLIENILKGRRDFDKFIEEVEVYLGC